MSFEAFDFAIGVGCGYPSERPAPTKRHKTDDGLVLPVFGPAVDVNRLENVACNVSSEVQRAYIRYRSMLDGDSDSSFLADDRPVIATSLHWLSKIVST